MLFEKRNFFEKNMIFFQVSRFLRAGPQLRVAKAARAPPCTLPILAQAPTLRLNHGQYEYGRGTRLDRLWPTPSRF